MTVPNSVHETHDPLAVVALAAGDLDDRDQAAAQALIRDCAACAELHADLIAVTRATHDLPSPARSRDYRLSPEDAARLRPGGWRRLVGLLAGPRFALARPVGAAFATLGVAGLLLTTLSGVPLPGSASPGGAPVDREAMTYQAAASAGPTAGDGAVAEDRLHATGAPAPVERPVTTGQGAGAGASEVPQAAAGGQDGGTPGQERQDGDSDIPSSAAAENELNQRTPDATLAILSGSFLILGAVLLGLRWTARRLGD